MRTLAIDIETYSSVDLKKSGVYPYVEAQDFEILLFAYSVDHGPVEIVDLAQGEYLPEKILIALTSPYVLKTAHNANFERTCIRKHFKTSLPVEQWSCTMAHAAQLGLPLSLEAAAKALKLEAEKSAAGKALIKYFSIPCKPTKANGGRTRNLPEHAPEKWQQFKEYCVQDVVVEQAIREKIQFFQIPETEKKLWFLDQQINDTGVLIDTGLVTNAIRIDVAHKEKLTTEAVELTELENPNSVAQLKSWFFEEAGIEIDSFNKTALPALMETLTACPSHKRVLELRQEMSKTSIKKYATMINSKCRDNRIRGLLQYYGANRTGRWAGRLVQVQNLKRIKLEDIDLARNIVCGGDAEVLELLFGSVPDVLSQLVRTSFVAAPGHRLIVCDFSAIEARVLAWLAGEKWRLDVFNTHGKIYEASASQMFKVPIEQVTKGSDYRQKGKMSELALGYGGGPDAIIRIETGNETPKEKRIPENELPKLVKMWRNANPKITQCWRDVENAAYTAVFERRTTSYKHGIEFLIEKGVLFIQLPSGRRLSYLRPQIRENRFGGESIVYEGMDQTTKRWGKQETYGGKLVENLCQAIARDCLTHAMLQLNAAKYKIVMHVHDEIVMEMPDGKGSIQEVEQIMGTPIPWAKGLPLAADGFESEYYKK